MCFVLIEVCIQLCTVCGPSCVSLALLACMFPAAVPCTGLHSWGEPWGRAAACPPTFMFFTMFPLAGPQSLQCMQLHSDILSFITAPLPRLHSPRPPILNTHKRQNCCLSTWCVYCMCAYHDEPASTSHVV